MNLKSRSMSGIIDAVSSRGMFRLMWSFDAAAFAVRYPMEKWPIANSVCASLCLLSCAWLLLNGFAVLSGFRVWFGCSSVAVFFVAVWLAAQVGVGWFWVCFGCCMCVVRVDENVY